MTSYERVLSSIAHERPDRTPCDLKAVDEVVDQLAAHLNLDGNEEVYRELGVDFRMHQVPIRKSQPLSEKIDAEYSAHGRTGMRLALRWPVAVLAIGFVMNMLLRGVSETYVVFLLPLGAEFGWSRTELTGVYSLYMLVHGACSPLAGPKCHFCQAGRISIIDNTDWAARDC